MLERTIERNAVRRAKTRGWGSQKIGINGKPDRLFYQRGEYVWIEFKAPSNRKGLTTLQAKEIDKLRALGCHVYVCYSVEECLECLARHEWWLNTAGL